MRKGSILTTFPPTIPIAIPLTITLTNDIIPKKTDEKYVVRPAVSLLINSSKAGSIVNSLDISALISPKNGFKISSN